MRRILRGDTTVEQPSERTGHPLCLLLERGPHRLRRAEVRCVACIVEVRIERRRRADAAPRAFRAGRPGAPRRRPRGCAFLFPAWPPPLLCEVKWPSSALDDKREMVSYL